MDPVHPAVDHALVEGVAPLHGDVVEEVGGAWVLQHLHDELVELSVPVVLSERHDPGGFEGTQDGVDRGQGIPGGDRGRGLRAGDRGDPGCSFGRRRRGRPLGGGRGGQGDDDGQAQVLVGHLIGGARAGYRRSDTEPLDAVAREASGPSCR